MLVRIAALTSRFFFVGEGKASKYLQPSFCALLVLGEDVSVLASRFESVFVLVYY